MGRSGAARRRSRKRRAEGRPPRRPAPAVTGPAVAEATGPVPAPARDRPGQRRAVERPRAPWHPVPLTEIAIVSGLVAFGVGLRSGADRPLTVGLVVLGLAVLELTAREHFAGFRSHSLLLAAIITVALAAGLHEAGGNVFSGPVALAVELPVFAGLTFLFRGRYRESREARSIGR
jgi:hypothetical protein